MSVRNQVRYLADEVNFAGRTAHDFVIIKLTDGVTVDRTRYPTYPEDRNAIDFVQDILPVPARGFYHYTRSAVHWEAQVENILETIALVVARYGQRPFNAFVADAEVYGNFLGEEFVDANRRILEAVEAELDIVSMLYSNTPTYEEMLELGGDDWMHLYDYFHAQYPFYGWHDRVYDILDGDESLISLPAGRTQKLWQCSADGNGMGDENGIRVIGNANPSLDLIVAKMTRAQLYQWWGVAEDPPKAMGARRRAHQVI